MKLANMCALEAYDFGLPGSSPGRATMCKRQGTVFLVRLPREAIATYTETKKYDILRTSPQLHRDFINLRAEALSVNFNR